MLVSAVALPLIAASMWGIVPLAQKELLQSGVSIAGIVFAASMFMGLLAITLLVGDRMRNNGLVKEMKMCVDSRRIMITLAIFLAAIGIGQLAFLYALKNNSTSMLPAIVAIASIAPLFTLVWAYLLNGKIASIGCAIGIVFICIGVACVSLTT